MILFEVKIYSVRRSTDFLGSMGSYNDMLIIIGNMKLKDNPRV